MLDFSRRLNGLIHTLAVKFAQDDLHIVTDLEIPTDDPRYMDELVEARQWGMSVLFVDANDIFPRNITAATEQIQHMNLLPVYSLNCHSMLYHKTLVLTFDALNQIEDKLLFAKRRKDIHLVRAASHVNRNNFSEGQKSWF